VTRLLGVKAVPLMLLYIIFHSIRRMCVCMCVCVCVVFGVTVGGKNI